MQSTHGAWDLEGLTWRGQEKPQGQHLGEEQDSSLPTPVSPLGKNQQLTLWHNTRDWVWPGRQPWWGQVRHFSARNTSEGGHGAQGSAGDNAPQLGGFHAELESENELG